MQCHQENILTSRLEFQVSLSIYISLSLSVFGVVTATGELLTRRGIVVVPQISHCLLHERGEEEQERSLEGRQA